MKMEGITAGAVAAAASSEYGADDNSASTGSVSSEKQRLAICTTAAQAAAAPSLLLAPPAQRRNPAGRITVARRDHHPSLKKTCDFCVKRKRRCDGSGRGRCRWAEGMGEWGGG